MNKELILKVGKFFHDTLEKNPTMTLKDLYKVIVNIEIIPEQEIENYLECLKNTYGWILTETL